MTVMIGIDPHKETHTPVAINSHEVVLDEFTLRASTGQVSRLCDWASDFENREWAVESANGLGFILARQLVAAGETVFAVSPMLASRVRVLGSGRSQKNDANDARSVAIAALRSDRIAQVRFDGHSRALRLLVKRDRFCPCGKHGPVDQVLLQSRKERFNDGIVLCTPDLAHRRPHMWCSEASGELGRGIFRATVRMKNGSPPGSPTVTGHQDRSTDQIAVMATAIA